MTGGGQSHVVYVATDVGLWMALPAFGPALLIVGVFAYIIRRDRRRGPDAAETGDGSAADERHEPQ